MGGEGELKESGGETDQEQRNTKKGCDGGDGEKRTLICLSL